MVNALRRLEGVQDVALDLERTVATIRPQADRVMDLALIPVAVREASDKAMRYEVDQMRILAAGVVEEQGGARRFLIDGWPRDSALAWEGPPVEGRCRVEAEVEAHPGGLRLRRVRSLPLRTPMQP